MAMAGCGNDEVAKRPKITHMYETVLNHTYNGHLKKKTSDAAVKNPNDYGKWGKVKTTHLVCKIDGDDPIIITNTPGKAPGNHAEEKLIQELIKKSKVKKSNDSSVPGFYIMITDKFHEMLIEERKKESKTEETKKLTIYINNSPCSNSVNNCTGELIKMLDGNVNVSLMLYVTSLYNIRRESCKEEYHNEIIYPEKHRANYKGLRNLMQHERCEINGFTEDVWKELFKMTTGSDQLPDDYDKKTDGNERSRKDEDKLIQADLDHIKKNQL